MRGNAPGDPRDGALPNAETPLYRLIVGVDAENSTRLSDRDRLRLREVFYDFTDRALTMAGMRNQYREQPVDRGDGMIYMIRPLDAAPKLRLLDRFVPAFNSLLEEHNAAKHGRILRARVAIGAGEVHYDGRGWCGADLDLTCLLLDHKKFKKYLAEISGPTAVILTDGFYQAIANYDFLEVSPVRFPSTVTVRIGKRRHVGRIGSVDRSQ